MSLSWHAGYANLHAAYQAAQQPLYSIHGEALRSALARMGTPDMLDWLTLDQVSKCMPIMPAR